MADNFTTTYDKNGNMIRTSASGAQYVVSPNDSLGRYVAPNTPSNTASNTVSNTSAGNAPQASMNNVQNTNSGNRNYTLKGTEEGIMKTMNSGAEYYVPRADPRYEALLNEMIGTQPVLTPAQAQYADTSGIYGGYAKLAQGGYDEAAAARRVAADNAKKLAEQSYNQAMKSAYINQQMAEKNLPQQLSSLGLSGTGMSESAALANYANYMNSMMQNQQNYGNQVAQIEQALGSENADDLKQLYTNMANAYLNQMNTDRSFDYNKSVNDRDFRYQQNRDNIEDAFRNRQEDFYEQVTRNQNINNLRMNQLNYLATYGIVPNWSFPWLGIDNTGQLQSNAQKAYLWGYNNFKTN